MAPKASICIATHNKFPTLERVLKSIYAQEIVYSGAVEVIVVDDGSDKDTRWNICLDYWRTDNLIIENIHRPPGYRNPANARNVTMKVARGEVLILQSDDVIHVTPNALELLVNDLRPGEYNIASVWNQYADGSLGYPYTGLENRRPYFFLGSVLREHVYAVGGNDEEFTEPGYDDNWFACCLHRGRGLEVNYRQDIVGYHQDHQRSHDVSDKMRELFWHKWNAAERGAHHWMAAAGPWEFTQTED